MRRLVSALVVFSSFSVFAQSVDINVGGIHAGVHVDTGETVVIAPPAQVVVQQAPPMRVVGADLFRFDYSPSAETRLVVTQPEGLAAQVWSEQGFEGQFLTPFAFAGQPGQFYRVILTSPDGAPVLDRKVELRRFNQLTVSMKVRPLPPPTVIVAQPAPVPMGMPPTDFGAILHAVEAEDFADDKLGVIQSAVSGGAWFTCAQVGELVDRLTMSDEKVQVVSITRARIVDPNNSFTLQKRFTFSSDKEKVRRLFGN